MVKTISTPRKINAILLNIKLNRPKLVSMRGYVLVINWQNFTEIYLVQVKILQKVLGGLLFLTHTVGHGQKSTSGIVSRAFKHRASKIDLYGDSIAVTSRTYRLVFTVRLRVMQGGRSHERNVCPSVRQTRGL